MACGIIIMGAIGWASLIALVVWQCVVLRTCQRHCRAMLLLPSAGLVAYALGMSLFASKLEWLMHMWLATPRTFTLGQRVANSAIRRASSLSSSLRCWTIV
ncbi:MAG: hypothetical protein ACJAYX_004311, partial [Planctomycetota bacterium]